MAQHLPADRRRKIEKLYLSGVKPVEIALKLGIKPASLRQHLYRAGLTQRRDELEEVKQQTAHEILDKVRRDAAGDLEDVLGDIAAGLKIDASRLRDGWPLVHDAAEASSLMRAKNLLLARTLRTFGVEKVEANPPNKGLNFFVLAPRVDPVKAAKPVEPAESTGTKQCVPSLLPTTP